MATGQLTPAAGIFHLPLTGRRNGKHKVVIGYTVVLDDEFTRDVLACRSWCLSSGYALTGQCRGEKMVFVHQFVYGHYHGPVPEGMEIDHVDRDRLNNLPSNLRAVTRSQNMANSGRRPNNTSGYVGVSWHKGGRKWGAKVTVMRKNIHLGLFLTREEAAAAVNRAYAEHFPHVPPPNLIVSP